MKAPKGFRKEHRSLSGNSQSSGDRDIVKECGVFISNFTIGRKVIIKEGFLDGAFLQMKYQDRCMGRWGRG